MIQSPLALTGLIALMTALAFWLDRRVAPLSRVGASLIAIVLGATLSNTGMVPVSSPVYDAIGGTVTSLAIAWLLLAVHLGDLRRAGKGMVGAFLLAAAGTALGAAVGAYVFADTFGEETWRLAGTLTGTYSGGSINFVAVGRGLELPDALFAGATAADNLTTGIWLGATLTLPLWLGRFFPTEVPGTRGHKDASPREAATGALAGEEGAAEDASGNPGGASSSDTASEHHPFFVQVSLSTLDLAVLVAVGFALLLVAEWMGTVVPAVPSVLWLTTLALLLGHTAPFRRPAGAMQLGTLALHFFFVIIGIHSRISEIVAVGAEVIFYTLVVVAVHGVVVYGAGRAFKLDVGTLSVASQAAVGGPSSALAVAVSREWRALILPGIIVGLLGYALGNYLGFGLAYLVRGLGVGL